MEKLIEKIMKTVGLGYSCEISREIPQHRTVCLRTKVFHKNNPKDIEVDFYSCYEYKRNGRILWNSGNAIKFPAQSMYFNFGKNDDAFVYFKSLSRVKAREYFENTYNSLTEEDIRRLIKKIIK
jgi:WD40 repeat protein